MGLADEGKLQKNDLGHYTGSPVPNTAKNWMFKHRNQQVSPLCRIWMKLFSISRISLLRMQDSGRCNINEKIKIMMMMMIMKVLIMMMKMMVRKRGHFCVSQHIQYNSFLSLSIGLLFGIVADYSYQFLLKIACLHLHSVLRYCFSHFLIEYSTRFQFD